MEWFNIPGHPYHQISRTSEVRSIPRRTLQGVMTAGKVLSVRLDIKGYLYTTLCEDGKPLTRSIHNLMAKSFIGPRPEGLIVNHKDGVKTNNDPGNLEYVTNQQNMDHARLTGLLKSRDTHPRSKLSEEMVREIRRLYNNGSKTYSQLSKMFGVSKSAIGKVVRNSYWPDEAYKKEMVRHNHLQQLNQKALIGEKHGASKLSDAEAREISRLRKEGVTLTRLANKFNVCYKTIQNIVGRKRKGM